MPNRIEELFAELAENVATEESQQQFQSDYQLQQMEAQRQLHDTPEARRALKIMGIISLLALTRGRSGGAGLPLNKAYGAAGKNFTKFIEPLKSKLSGVFGRSGSGVGADVVGRYALPTAKSPIVTKQGPRGPINIESPMGPPRPAPPKGTRNTGGISDAERAQLPSPGIPSTSAGKATKSYMDKVNRLKFLEGKLHIDQAKINAGEAPSKNFNKMLEEAVRLRALLKSLE